MKSIHPAVLRDGLLAEFLQRSPKEQAALIRQLPTMAEKIAAVREILFAERLHDVIKLLSPLVVTRSFGTDTHNEFEKEVLSQPYFVKIWNVMKNNILPGELYEAIPPVLLCEALNEKLSQLSSFWAEVATIEKVFDDEGACAFLHGLHSDEEDQRDAKKAYNVQRWYLKQVKKVFASLWITKLFESISPGLKAALVASVTTTGAVRKLLGLMMTYHSPAEKSDFFVEITIGSYFDRIKDENDREFPSTFKEMVTGYKTKPSVIAELLEIFVDYREVFNVLSNSLPVAILKKVIEIKPELKEALLPDLVLLVKKDVGFADTKGLVRGSRPLPGSLARRVKNLSPAKRLALLIQ